MLKWDKEEERMLTEVKPIDRRVRRTKKLLKESFIKLLEEKPYERITVKDIVETADYNRATFYNHYKYKEELVDDIVNEIENGLMEATKSYFHANYYYIYSTTSCKITAITRIIFEYVCENKELFKLWKYSEAIPGLYERFLDTITDLVKKACHQNGKEKLEMNNDLFATFYAYGIMGLIVEWIKSDFVSSPAYMVNQCEQIVKQ